MAFILAGLIFIVTIGLVVLIVGADMMSDSPTTSINPMPTLIGGITLAALVAASHWLPHIGW